MPECDGVGQILDAPDRVLDGRAYWEVCRGTGKVEVQSPHFEVEESVRLDEEPCPLSR